MSDGRQPRSLSRPFPLIVGRQPTGEPPPTAGSGFAGQVRTFIGVAGYVDGLYICDTNLAGTWGWFKIHGHGQPLNAQVITGGLTVTGGAGVTGALSASSLSAGSATIGVISGGTVVGATTGSFVNLSVVNAPWRVMFRGSRTFDPPSIPAQSQASFDVTVTGATNGDVAAVGTNGGFSAGLFPYAYISNVNTATVVLANFTASAIDMTSNTFNVIAIR